MGEPILIEDDEGLNVITTLEEARIQISLLRADNRHLRKSVMRYKEEINHLYESLTLVRQAVSDGIDFILNARSVR